MPKAAENGNFFLMSLTISASSETVQQHLQTIFGDYEEAVFDQSKDNFSLEEKNKTLELYQNKKLISTYQLPIKVGIIIGKVQLILLQKRQKRKSRPIDLTKFILFPIENKLQHTKTDKDILLTDKEFDILIALHSHHPKKMARDDLLNKIWGYGEEIETHTLETHIYRLRQKIEDDPSNPDFLKTDDDGYYLDIA